MAGLGDNLELQHTYLQIRQAEISGDLFDSGAAIAIATARAESWVPKRVSLGSSFVDSTCVPTMTKVRWGQIDTTMLGMSRLVDYDEAGQQGVAATYLIGPIDDEGELYPASFINPLAAKMVYNAALDLVLARDEGILPNLSADLLCIEPDPTLL